MEWLNTRCPFLINLVPSRLTDISGLNIIILLLCKSIRMIDMVKKKKSGTVVFDRPLNGRKNINCSLLSKATDCTELALAFMNNLTLNN